MPDTVNRSLVEDTPSAESRRALAHFESLLAFETDCWDVHASLDAPDRRFVLLDVRPPDRFRDGHIAGAVSLPHGRIVERNLAAYPPEALFVVYCDGPQCNGADKAAVRLARLGRPVKKMIGGVWGWIEDGFTLTSDGA